MLSAIFLSSCLSQQVGAVKCERGRARACVLTAKAESVLKSGGSELGGLTDSLSAPFSKGLLSIEWS